jgi:hypothetical protein
MYVIEVAQGAKKTSYRIVKQSFYHRACQRFWRLWKSGSKEEYVLTYKKIPERV